MPALSFQEMWIDKLLSGAKRQTTRKMTDRIKPGDVCHIYNQQRGRIADKPLRKLTQAGIAKMKAAYPFAKATLCEHHAHFLGKVLITEVFNIHPCEMTEAELKAWAMADGFKDFDTDGAIDAEFLRTHQSYANWWFSDRYGNDWMQRWWTVERWDGWMERYFEPEAIR